VVLHAAGAYFLLPAVRGVRAEPFPERPDSWTGSTFEVEAAPDRARGAPRPPAEPEAGSERNEPSDRSAAWLPAPPRPHKAAPRRAAARAHADPPREVGSSAEAGKGSEPGGRYGAEGSPEGVRNLARAFTRAMPPATSLDRAWREMPVGRAGTLRIELVIERGKLEEVKGLDGAPLHLRRLVERTVKLIERGRFALALSDLDSGREVLLITAQITARAARDNDLADSDAVMELGSEGPTRERPGRAFFTLASGRHVEVTVRVLTGHEAKL
jgi:hypothetical protein